MPTELHAAATPAATRFFLLVTTLGFQVLWVIGVGGRVCISSGGEWLRLGVWVAALAAAKCSISCSKQCSPVRVPQFADPLAVALYYSFPSGHAMMSLITYGLLAYFLFVGLPRAWLRVPVSAALILLILLIGFSRLYLGVHYVSDMLAGFAVGGLWLSFCITAMNFMLDGGAPARTQNLINSITFW